MLELLVATLLSRAFAFKFVFKHTRKKDYILLVCRGARYFTLLFSVPPQLALVSPLPAN